MIPNDNYEPQVGDLVTHVGEYPPLMGEIGVILGSELLYTGYGTRRRKAMVFHIKFPSQILSLRPRHFKVIKKVNKKT
jgi:hypothetical protein|tara:strand:- start:456 stop:689 length:234 start_codon:yes stop_codon:yes gene_type:complete